MASYQLRLYTGPTDDAAGEPCEAEQCEAEKRTVTVPLETLFPLLADASATQLAWLKDFGDDDVTISEDLYEIVQAFAALKAA